MKLEHFVLTCFNIDRGFSRDREGRAVRTVEWHEYRFELFERYCLPSMLGQTNGRFIWLIAYDPCTPKRHLEQLRRYTKEFPRIELVPWVEGSRGLIVQRFVPWVKGFPAAIARMTGPADLLVTTRLDSDDALHREAVSLIQECAAGTFEFLNMTWGYSYSHLDGEVRLRKYLSNPFLTLVEPRRGAWPRTAMCCNHNHASEIAPVRQIGDGPMWLRVVHDRNISTSLTGEDCGEPQLAEFGLVSQ